MQDCAAVDLMLRMLEYNSAKRITAAAALQHPYFKEVASCCSRVLPPVALHNRPSKGDAAACTLQYPKCRACTFIRAA